MDAKYSDFMQISLISLSWMEKACISLKSSCRI